MVKRWCAALLCTLLTVSLTGCGSLLNREWYEVKDHSPTYYALLKPEDSEEKQLELL